MRDFRGLLTLLPHPTLKCSECVVGSSGLVETQPILTEAAAQEQRDTVQRSAVNAKQRGTNSEARVNANAVYMDSTYE